LLVGGGAAPAPAIEPSIVLARLVSPSFGIVATSTVSGTRLFARLDDRSWQDISPPRVLFQPEDIVFLDRRQGWFVANDRSQIANIVRPRTATKTRIANAIHASTSLSAAR
jgi:hypothetical protein